MNQDFARTEDKGHILVCLSSSPSNIRVVKTAAKMAEAFQCEWTALYVETSGSAQMPAEDRKRLMDSGRLAEKLGARIATVYGEDVPIHIAEYARIGGISKIVIGRTNSRRFFEMREKPMAERLIALMPDMDFYIIPDTQPKYRKKTRFRGEKFRFSVKDVVKTFLVLAMATVLGLVFFELGLGESTAIMLYILGVLLISVWTSARIYGALASCLSVLLFNFVFTEPRYTLRAYDARYPVTFTIMLLASFMTSSLAMRLMKQAKLAAREAYRTGILLETSQKLQQAESREEILYRTGIQIRKLLDRTVLLYPASGDAELGPGQLFAGDGESAAGGLDAEDRDMDRWQSEKELQAAGWVRVNGKQAGQGTKMFPDAECLYMAVRGEHRVHAVAGIVMEGKPALEPFEKNLLLAVLDSAGLILEKQQLNEEKRQAQLQVEQESLRANLLRSISHDLRTPLTSISGNAGILMEKESLLDEDRKHQMYTSIYEDAIWLNELVENLLSVTRIENGTMELKKEPELLEEVIREAVHHLDRKAGLHQVEVELPDDLLMALMDARLIGQVLINIINNAVKYTQEGSRIVISARRVQNWVLVEIADDGPGVPDEAKDKLFDMFYTVGKAGGDGRRGLGLGLALCKSIIHAHGGQIGVRDNVPKGSVFYFTLQLAEVKMYE